MTEDACAVYRQRIDGAIDDRQGLEALRDEIKAADVLSADDRDWLLERVDRYVADLDDAEEILPDEPEGDGGAGA
jgi:hypothetical protein